MRSRHRSIAGARVTFMPGRNERVTTVSWSFWTARKRVTTNRPLVGRVLEKITTPLQIHGARSGRKTLRVVTLTFLQNRRSCHVRFSPTGIWFTDDKRFVRYPVFGPCIILYFVDSYDSSNNENLKRKIKKQVSFGLYAADDLTVQTILKKNVENNRSSKPVTIFSTPDFRRSSRNSMYLTSIGRCNFSNHNVIISSNIIFSPSYYDTALFLFLLSNTVFRVAAASKKYVRVVRLPPHTSVYFHQLPYVSARFQIFPIIVNVDRSFEQRCELGLNLERNGKVCSSYLRIFDYNKFKYFIIKTKPNF